MPEHDTHQSSQGISTDVMYERIHGDIKVINTKYDSLEYLVKLLNTKFDKFESDMKQGFTSADASQSKKIESAINPINSTISELKTTVDKIGEKTGNNMIDIAKIIALFTPITAILIYFIYQLINTFVNK